MASIPDTHRAVRLHPEDHSIRVETIPTPRIEHPDDVIVKVKYAGLCGSDLHGYRGHEEITQVIVTGHEFVGEVVAMGSSFSPAATDRPPLYSSLKIGDKVVAPFTSSCAECHFCRIGFTSRCAHQRLFGTVALPGAQAQYVRVPKAGGTLFVIDPSTSPLLSTVSDISLLLLADILPTGVFAALQTIQHPKILPILTGERYPLAVLGNVPGFEAIARPFVDVDAQALRVEEEDRVLTVAIVGLGPVGICALISLLDILSSLTLPLPKLRLLAIDPVPSRRAKAQSIFAALKSPSLPLDFVEFKTATPEEALAQVDEWTGGVGCNAVLEIVGTTPALTLSLTLLRPFGLLTSVGVHQAPPVPFTGRQLYDKNVAMEFGRCPVRAVFPLAVEVLGRHSGRGRVGERGEEGGQGMGSGVFGAVGEETSLVERVVSLEDAAEAYRLFEKGEVGKVVFVP